MVFGKLLPREGNFFELFNEHGSHIAQARAPSWRMVQNYADATLREQHAAEVDAAERAADRSPPRSTGCCTRPSSRRSTASRSTA